MNLVYIQYIHILMRKIGSFSNGRRPKTSFAREHNVERAGDSKIIWQPQNLLSSIVRFIMGGKIISQSTAPPLEQASDDSSSFGSLPYFHSSDFAKSSWSKTVGYYGVPSLGLAILAIIHPLFFLAGAGVAAASYGVYEICNNSGGIDIQDANERKKEDLVGTQVEIETLVPETSQSRTGDVSLSESFYAPTICTEVESLIQISPLANSILANETFSGLTALEFFNVFLGNNAVFSFAEFQRKRGDMNIEYKEWIDRKRQLRFETPTKQLFGPAYAIATKNQHLVKKTKHCVMMESKTTLEKIPFCNTFCVREQWYLSSVRDASGKPTTTLSVTAQVDFNANNPFEGQIKHKSMMTMREVLDCWCKMAHEAILLTEQRAEARMKRQEKESEKKKDQNAIEVTYNDSRKASAIVGDVTGADDETDWEMDPSGMLAPQPVVPKTRRLLLSLRAVRRSLSTKFVKKFVSDM